MKRLCFIILSVIVLFGCAQTPQTETKGYNIKPVQVVNNITIIPADSMEMLIKLNREDLEKAIQLLNRHGGVVMSMGAWGIKVEGIRAERTTTSEATSDASLDANLNKNK